MTNLFFLFLGLIFGSFIAAYSYRYPRNIKISSGFSFCDKCKRKINWYENIPVISYLILGGKCSACKRGISFRYPLIEIITGLAFMAIFYFRVFIPFNFVFAIIVYLVLSMIFIIDLEHQIIPDDFIFVGMALTFVYRLLFSGSYLYESIFSGFMGSFFLLLIFLLTNGRGMGLGDVKFAVLGGMLVGLTTLFIWMLSAFLTGATCGIILILIGNAKLKDKIAFGPFLVVSIPIALIWGQKLTELVF